MNKPTINIPQIKYYGLMANTTQVGKVTPKFTIVKDVGLFSPMELLRGRNGLVSMNLMEKLNEGENVPSMRLQAKGSVNFTGLKEYFQDGKISGYAYGYPDPRPTYSSKNKPNPFFDYKDDGYLFIFHYDEDPTNHVPTSIELIVLEKAKYLISTYCKMLMMGGFDEALKQCREQAQTL